jgi:hypothetical protein
MAVSAMLVELPPISLMAGVGQMEVPDDSHPGLRRGDRLFTVPCHRFAADDLYVLAFPGEHYGLWRCGSTMTFRDPGIFCWKDGQRPQTLRRLTPREFEDVVVAQVAGWLHIRDRRALYRDL